MKKILLASATPFEIAPLLATLQVGRAADLPAFSRHKLDGVELSILITGVGLPLAAFSLATVLARDSFDLAIQAGVGGALDPQLALEQVVEVISDRFADLGVEEANGQFVPISQLGLANPDTYPFKGGALWNEARISLPDARQVHGISVNRVHGYAPSIAAVRATFPDAQVESMEGAAFFYACLQHRIPCQQWRAISNYVEPRNRAGWRLEGAIHSLNQQLLSMIAHNL